MTDQQTSLEHHMAPWLQTVDLVRGLVVSWTWGNNSTGDMARQRGLRPIGVLVSKADHPHMVCTGGPLNVRLLDEEFWMFSPYEAITKGMRLYRTPEQPYLGPALPDFDIQDGRNRYQPCPACGSGLNMGLVNRRGQVAVQCMDCGARGPAFPFDPARPLAADQPAFDAWNGQCRSRSLGA